MDVKWLTLYDIYPYTFNHVNSIEPYLLYTANKHRFILEIWRDTKKKIRYSHKFAIFVFVIFEFCCMSFL